MRRQAGGPRSSRYGRVWQGGAACALALCLTAGPLQGQEALRFARIEGLPHHTVHALLQDRHGFVWVGTADGLARYDGYGARVWRHDPTDPASLSDNTAQALLEDPSGALWVGTASGLNRFDPWTGQAERIAPAGLDVAALALDPDGGLWVEGFGAGLHRLDPAARRLVRVGDRAVSPYGAAIGRAVSFATGPDGTLWKAESTPSGAAALHRFAPGQAGFVREADPPSGVIGLYAGPSGTLWARASGVVLAGPLAPPFRAVPPPPDGADGSILLEDHRGRLWVGGVRGVYTFDPTGGALTRCPLDPTDETSLSNHVLALLEDHAGAVWVGTRSGLFRWDPHRKPFRHLTIGRDLPVDLGPVMALAAEGDGGLWVGGLGGGLAYVGAAGTARYRAGPGGLPSDRVWALHATPGALWIGTDGGLARLDRRTGRLTSRRLPARPPDLHYVYTLADDGAGGLWAGGGFVLYRLDAEGAVRGRLDLTHRIPNLTTVQALHADRSGALWIGTEKAGLWRWVEGRLERIATDDVTATTTVWAIHEDAAGVLWLGTGAGLVRLDPGTDTTRLLYAPAALPGGIVYSIQEDAEGRLWLGTSRGLVRYDPSTDAFRAYDRTDGIGEEEYDRRAAARAPDGTLYVGGLTGVTAFQPEAIRDDPVPPPVAVTAVTAVGPGATRALLPVGPEPLRLSHREDLVTFAFVALGFSDVAKQRYAYRLDGHDAGWVEAEGDRRARYSNLPPGRYTFRVRAANRDGVWNEEGAALAVVVAPALWQTAWFRLLALGALAGLLYAGYRRRLARLLEVERLRMRIASDLHDEIGSKLSSVALLSEMVARGNGLDPRARGRLDEVTRVARGLADDLRDIVWFVNPRYDTVEDLVARLQHAAADLLPETPCRFDLPPDGLGAGLPMERRRHLYLLLREALHNAARHAHAETVHVRAGRRDGHLLVEVRDDGAGFDPACAAGGEGLRTMRARAEALGGTLVVESAPGAGTAVRLDVPLT